MKKKRKRKPKQYKYRCKHCKKVMLRDKDQQWIKSYCETAERTVHLMRVM